jgi:deoxyadenosine/deoxycytidine kinase
LIASLIDYRTNISRIVKRGRDYEQIVEREYWEKLNSYYTQYFNEYQSSTILRINVDGLDFENNLKDRAYVLSLIDQKLAVLKQIAA